MLNVLILGTAAGGGFPQWNCACQNCCAARAGKLPARLQSSLAVSGDGQNWHLVNASPDVTRQIEQFVRPKIAPSPDQRQSPIRTIFITNADLDHTLGLLQVREGQTLEVTAPTLIRRSLENGLNLSSTLNVYCGLEWREASTEWRPVDATGLEIKAAPLTGTNAPRYDSTGEGDSHATGYLFRVGAASIGVFPDVAELTPELVETMSQCDRVWFDGTFWDNDEMLHLSGRTATQMGHIPIGGGQGSLARLESLGNKLSYLHINNTNPILRPDSKQRQILEAAGARVAEEGELITLV